MAADFEYEGLQQLTDAEIRVLFRELDKSDLANALLKTSDELKEKLLRNLSERSHSEIEEEMKLMERLGAGAPEPAQERILEKAIRLAEKGQLSWPPVKRAKPSERPQPPKEYLELKETTRTLLRRQLWDLSYEEIDGLFSNLSEIARTEGILSLNDLISDTGDPFLIRSLHLVIDGTESQLAASILQNWIESRLHEHLRKHQKVAEGISAIQSGETSRGVKNRLSVLY